MNAGIDPVIHAPKRLAILSVLSASSVVRFSFLRDHLDVSDSDLSDQMAALAAAGYVSTAKYGRGTTYKMTKDGEAAYVRHVAALQAMIGGELG